MPLHSNYLLNAWLDATFNATAFSVSTVYASLHTGTTGTTGTNEKAGVTRVNASAAFPAASGGAIATNATITFSSVPADTYTYIGFWDASSGGNFLMGALLAPQEVLNAGDSLVINSGSFTDTLS